LTNQKVARIDRARAPWLAEQARPYCKLVQLCRSSAGGGGGGAVPEERTESHATSGVPRRTSPAGTIHSIAFARRNATAHHASSAPPPSPAAASTVAVTATAAAWDDDEGACLGDDPDNAVTAPVGLGPPVISLAAVAGGAVVGGGGLRDSIGGRDLLRCNSQLLPPIRDRVTYARLYTRGLARAAHSILQNFIKAGSSNTLRANLQCLPHPHACRVSGHPRAFWLRKVNQIRHDERRIWSSGAAHQRE